MKQENINEPTSYDFEREVVKFVEQGYKIEMTTIEVNGKNGFMYKAILRKYTTD